MSKDIAKAARISEVHGKKPSNLSEEEWTIVLAHGTRKASTTSRKDPIKRGARIKAKKSINKGPEAYKVVVKNRQLQNNLFCKIFSCKKNATKATIPRPARRSRRATAEATSGKKV